MLETNVTFYTINMAMPSNYHASFTWPWASAAINSAAGERRRLNEQAHALAEEAERQVDCTHHILSDQPKPPLCAIYNHSQVIPPSYPPNVVSS